MSNFESLRERLLAEKYPHLYVHKFVGSNTLAFMEAVEKWQALFPKAQLITRRMSHQERYVAYTFSFPAESADEIIQFIEATSLLQDLKIII